MRTGLSAWLLGLALALVALNGAQAQIWSEYRPEGGRYRVLMPGTPQLSDQDIALPDGRKVKMYQAAIETSNAAYLGTHVDYPADLVSKASPDTLLDNVRNGSSRGHTLRSEQRLTIAGNPGREYVIARANGVVLVTRSFLVGNRLYQIIVAGRPGVEQAPETRRFLDSFALLQ